MRRSELNYAAGVLCLGVCLVHVLSPAIAELDRQSWQFALAYWCWKLCSCAVPVFLVLGGVKVGLKPSGDYPGYLKRRARRVLLPYLIAFAVYCLVFRLLGIRTLSLKAAGKELLLGTLSVQFYYVILTLQFYLLLPLWRRLLDRVPFWAALAGSLLVTMLWRSVPTLLERGDIHFLYNDRVFPTYLFFWVTGLYLGLHYPAFLEGLRQPGTLWTLGLSALLAVGAAFYSARTLAYIPTIGIVEAMGDLCAGLWLLGILFRLEERGPGALKRALSWLGEGSYQIYLWHLLFLTVLEFYLPPLALGPRLLLRALAAFGGSLGLRALLKLPGSRGKRQRSRAG